jgi:hypothetical protein
MSMKRIDHYFPNIKDALYNVSKDVAHSKDQVQYGKGLLVGVVSAVMASKGFEFEEAVEAILPYMPKEVVSGCIPPSWQSAFKR